MTRKHILPIVAAIALIVGTLAFRLWPRTLKPEECSVLYQRYAESPDICATYIKNYRVNDTLTLNATLLEATTDSGWAILLKDFNISPLPPEILARIKHKDAVTSWYVLHGTSDGPMDTVDKGKNDFVVASEFEHIITIFEIKSRDHMSAVFDNQYAYLDKYKQKNPEEDF